MAKKNTIQIIHDLEKGGLEMDAEIIEGNQVEEIMTMLTTAMTIVIRKHRLDVENAIDIIKKSFRTFGTEPLPKPAENRTVSVKQVFLAMAKLARNHR